ncbi:MAG: MOSC N-terminal beta barrel domain-containing protein, partial [Pseudomonadota bacterium]|nr:MOSC N-terminal beta barrel domain-containing protein [Pseudomonadota bacterium]
MIIDELWQYPVKGLGGVTLAEARLQAGTHFPGDRRFAVTNGHPRNADMAAGQWRKKALFLQLMSNERLAALECSFSGSRLVIREQGEEHLDVDLYTADGAAAAGAFFTAFCGDAIAGPATLTRMDAGAFTDTEAAWISLGGTASVAQVATTFGHLPDARRYRLNIMLK